VEMGTNLNTSSRSGPSKSLMEYSAFLVLPRKNTAEGRKFELGRFQACVGVVDEVTRKEWIPVST
jgi:hypothetical protein